MMRVYFLIAIFVAAVFQTVSAQTSDKKSSETLRVISLAPNLTEFLNTLNGGKQLVGITNYHINYPTASKPELIGGYDDPNKELIVSLKPDLVLALESERQLEAHLSDLNLEVLSVKCVSVNDIKSSFLEVAKAIGELPKAKQIVQQFEKDWKLPEKSNDENKDEILLVLNHPATIGSSVYCVGPNTFLDEFITQLGGKNWFADSTQIYPTLSREDVISNPPDIIIEVNIEDFNNRQHVLVQEYWRDYLTPEIYADINFVVAYDRMITVPSMNLAESLNRLRGQIAAEKRTKAFSLSP